MLLDMLDDVGGGMLRVRPSASDRLSLLSMALCTNVLLGEDIDTEGSLELALDSASKNSVPSLTYNKLFNPIEIDGTTIIIRYKSLTRL
jgi:hypothetical protein